MKGHPSHVIVSIWMLLMVRNGSFCVGYVCLRHPGSFRRCQRQIRVAESPSTSLFSTTETFSVDEQKRLSKRVRLKNTLRRFRMHFAPSSSRDAPEDATQSYIDALPLEKAEKRDIYNSSDESAGSLRQEPPSSVGVKLEETPTLVVAEVKEPTSALSSDDDLTMRQTKAAANNDLSGTWKPIVTDAFKRDYDAYLVGCGENVLRRKIIVNGIGFQREAIRQLNDGVELEIVATNPAGNWNRTLVTSGNATIVDPDGDEVQVESWWEGKGTRHRSILRGKPRVQGGVFDTVRYLESDDVLVCEADFVPVHASSNKFARGHVVWKFQRVS